MHGENGILNKAKYANQKNKESQDAENIALADYNNKMDSYITSRGDSGSYGLTANTNVYVSVSGNDAGSGAIDNPFKTIQKAVDACPNQTNGFIYNINITPGTYDAFKVLGKYIIITTDTTKATPVITGQTVIMRDSTIELNGSITFNSDGKPALVVCDKSMFFSNWVTSTITVTSTNLANNWDGSISIYNGSQFYLPDVVNLVLNSNQTGMFLDIGSNAYVAKSQGTCTYTGFLVARGSEVCLGSPRLSYRANDSTASVKY